MIIGFLGKGGSGKTTLSTAAVHFLTSQNNTVLAIDADHNMDLTYNLGIKDTIPYLSNAMPKLREKLGMNEHYRDFFATVDTAVKNGEFNASPFSIAKGHLDSFTREFSTPIKEELRIMSAGPHTEDVLHGNHCSHSLSTPLRVYLPLLKLNSNEFVVVDEKAGRDGVGTGTPTGFDIAFIATEPTEHGMKAASQIAEILDFFETPYEFVLNRSEERHLDESWLDWKRFLSKKPVLKIPKMKSQSDDFSEYFIYMEKLVRIARETLNNTPPQNLRYPRSVRKFKKQKEYIQHK